ncbi:MAG: hypothetical protein GY841_01860 [FCB group bacterium]|nr:hypothetical protein [FCB group bacterium]
MTRPDRFLRQVFRHIGRDKRISLGSFLVLAIVLVLIDLFWIATININHHYDRILQTVRMEVFLSNDIPDSVMPVIENALLSFDGVDTVGYISKDDAARILETDLGPGILGELDINPLPRSFIIHFDRTLDLAALDQFNDQINRLDGVIAVEYGRPWIEKMENAGQLLRRVGLAVGGLILFIVLLTMANTNRLTARSKSREFFQLKLLGAGPSYLIYPFLTEGFLSGFIAAAFGWIFILYAVDYVTFSQFVLLLPTLEQLGIYVIAAGLTGMIGAWLGIRRFLVS